MNDLKLGGWSGVKNAALSLAAAAALILPASCSSALIFNFHEHIQSPEAAALYLQAAQAKGISKTVLLGSPEATFDRGIEKLSGMDVHNEILFEIDKKFPDAFILFPAVDLMDPSKRLKVKEYAKRGAKGIKLYGGHQQFHKNALDDTSHDSFYSECAEHNMVVMMHVNTGLYARELEGVLKKHATLKVVCPHYCLSTIRADRLEYLMLNYPQLYTDVSLGRDEFLIPALRRFSAEPDRYKKLITKFQDRFLFGTDLVVMNGATESAILEKRIQVYRDLLELKTFSYPGLSETLNGFELPAEVLKKIYRTNAEKLLSSKS